MENLTIMSCPKCGKSLRFPSDRGTLRVTCPMCKAKSVFAEGKIRLDFESKNDVKPKQQEATRTSGFQNTPRQGKPGKRAIVISAVLAFLIIAGLVITIISINAKKHEHLWLNATCDQPKTCSICGETEGAPNGHVWDAATCTEPKTCAICGITEGSVKEHAWVDASCTAPKTCSVCGLTEGTALGHDWAEATCTKPKTCTRCNEKQGEALDHLWSEETETSPSICSRCGKMQPMTMPESGHVYIGAGMPTRSTLTITTDSRSFYVKLKDSSGNEVFSFFARANETTTVSVPAGQYYVYFASGVQWYGPKYYFGKNTSFSKDDTLADFSQYTISYTMHSVFNGIFKDTPVSADEFG